MTNDEITQLLFTADSIFGTPIQSRVSNADNIFPVRLLPLALARKLQELNNPIWIIHFYPTHAELWLSCHWNESYSRRISVIQESRLRVQHHTELKEGADLMQVVTYAVITRMQQQRLNIGIGAAMLTAYEILKGTISTESIEMLGLTDIFIQYGNKANEQQDRDTDTSTEDPTDSPAERSTAAEEAN